MRENNSIFQIYIQDDENLPLPKGIIECIEITNNNRGEFDHYLLKLNDAKSLITERLGADISKYIDKINPYAYKADFIRYCILYIYGGWYIDSTVRLNITLESDPQYDLIVFRDAPTPNRSSWDVSNAFFYAKKGDVVLESAIKNVMINIDEKHYGCSALAPTGPTLFGRCLALNGEKDSTQTGMLMPLTPYHDLKNYAFILPNGNILAWGKKSWGSISGEGLGFFSATGTNSYIEMYKLKKVY